MVNGSTFGFLDLSRTDSGSEESLITITVFTVDSAEVRNGRGSQLVVVGFSLVFGGELVGYSAGLDLSIGVESVERRLSDGDHLLEHIPQNALGKRRSGQTARVGPASIRVQIFDECSHIELQSRTPVVGNESCQELVVPVAVGGKVLIGHHLEDEAEHSVAEAGAFLLRH